jgi:D-arabinose 1-dehydrogenase-like Zn-dependent alcohol dehydrogenase
LLCENLGAYGVTLNGGFADCLKVKADRVFAIRNLSAREAVASFVNGLFQPGLA